MVSCASMDLFETIRLLHADIEQGLCEIVRQRLIQPLHPRHAILIEHFILQRTKLITHKATQLMDLYESREFQTLQNVAKKVETNNTDLSTVSTPHASTIQHSFETEVVRLREQHRKHPQPPVNDRVIQELTLEGIKVHPLVSFTVEEQYGACLDLEPHYRNFVSFLITAKGSEKFTQPTLLQFAESLKSIGIGLEEKKKAFELYSTFIIKFRNYICNFCLKTRPLQTAVDKYKRTSYPHSAQLSCLLNTEELLKQFESQWERKTLPGWSPTVQITGVSDEALRKVAQYEFEIQNFVESYEDILRQTVQRLSSKQHMTSEEFQHTQQVEEERFVAAFNTALEHLAQRERGAADQTVHPTEGIPSEEIFENLKGFPLDQEGKPIPVWLYLLHGLNLKRFCQICMQDYYGDRPFADHFSQARHISSLARLGITPFSEEFRYVSKRQDAIDLQRKLLKRKRDVIESSDDEEVEDAMGHVVTRRQLRELNSLK